MYEQTKSESNKGPINKKNRRQLLDKITIRMESETNTAIANQKLAERNNKIGIGFITAENIIKGSSDRLKAIPYDKDKYMEKREQEAYAEGFFEHGNRELSGKIEMLTEQKLKAIGYNDYISGVDVKTLPETIKTNPAYTEGYLIATITENKKGKRR